MFDDLQQIYVKIFHTCTGYNAGDDENSRLNANLCKSVSIGTGRRFIPTSEGANLQKNIQCSLLLKTSTKMGEKSQEENSRQIKIFQQIKHFNETSERRNGEKNLSPNLVRNEKNTNQRGK